MKKINRHYSLYLVLSLSVAILNYATHIIIIACNHNMLVTVSGILYIVPESPAWLANRGQLQKAEDAFFWVRGRSSEAAEELHAMLQRQASLVKEDPSVRSTLAEIRRPEFWQPLLIINFFFVAMQLCGVNAVAFYSVTIMQNTVGKGLDRYAGMLAIDTIRMIMSVVACGMVRR